MRYADPAEAAEAAILGGPLAGLFASRLDPAARAQVRGLLGAHRARVGLDEVAAVALPAEIRVVVAEAPAPT